MKFNSVIKTIICLCLIFAVKFVKAQSFGVSTGIEYETPVGQFGYKYKPAPSFNLSVLQIAENGYANITVAYAKFKPKQDVFYYLTDDGTDYGTATFTDFETYSAYLGFMRFINVSDVFKIELGGNLGAYFTHNVEKYKDSTFDSTTDVANTNVYLAPKIGFAYHLSDHVVLNAQAKYNFFTPTFHNDPSTPAFNTESLVIYRTWSSGISFTYLF